jgi:ABC-2 type transport system ATP-binding protein
VDAGSLDDLLVSLTRTGVRTLVSQPPTLEELFLRHYGEQSPAEPAAASR